MKPVSRLDARQRFSHVLNLVAARIIHTIKMKRVYLPTIQLDKQKGSPCRCPAGDKRINSKKYP
jgi:hypothetical protein